MKKCTQTLGVAVRTTLVVTVLTGMVYPLVITLLAQGLFPAQANGSMLPGPGGRTVGSALLAQGFVGAGYFQPRPSAGQYNAMASGGSNLGPTSQKLQERARAQAAALRQSNPQAPGPVPVDLVTTSGSGLDPHVSPAAALWQAPRVAATRGVAVARVQALVQANVEGRDWGFLGEPRVNVLQLNLALDRQLGQPSAVP